jgi:phospholipid/cholesterol/gamma-HCH transport system permease protein
MGLTWVGVWTNAGLAECGRVARILVSALRWSFRPPLRLRLFSQQLLRVGVYSIPVVLITGAFTGMVLALQTASAFRLFGAENLVASVVSLSMVRELGPVLTGLMVAGRVGSAMASELGTMRVTEQIDALHTLGTNPIQYLVVPRLWAATLALPCLVVFSVLVGIFGGRLIAVGMLDTSPVVYYRRAVQFLGPGDLGVGLTKAALFGFALALVGCYQGYSVRGGAREVGFAVNRAVVWAITLILMLNYIVTAFSF